MAVIDAVTARAGHARHRHLYTMIVQRGSMNPLARISIFVSIAIMAGGMACRPNGADMAHSSQRQESDTVPTPDTANTAEESETLASRDPDFRERWAQITREGTPAQVDELLAAWRMAEPDNPEIYVLAANHFFHKAIREGGVQISTKRPRSQDSVLIDRESGNVAGSISPGINQVAGRTAAQLLREATEKFPYRFDIWMGLAHIYKELGDIDAHCAVLEKGLNYAASHPADLKWINGEQLPADPTQFVPDAVQGHVGFLFEQGSESEDRFLRLASLVADLYPEHPYPINNLAAYYSGKEDWPQALGYLEKAHALAPKDALIMLNLGFVHSQLGENGKARMYYEHVLASDADEQVLDEARARLTELK